MVPDRILTYWSHGYSLVGYIGFLSQFCCSILEKHGLDKDRIHRGRFQIVQSVFNHISRHVTSFRTSKIVSAKIYWLHNGTKFGTFPLRREPSFYCLTVQRLTARLSGLVICLFWLSDISLATLLTWTQEVMQRWKTSTIPLQKNRYPCPLTLGNLDKILFFLASHKHLGQSFIKNLNKKLAKRTSFSEIVDMALNKISNFGKGLLAWQRERLCIIGTLIKYSWFYGCFVLFELASLSLEILARSYIVHIRGLMNMTK